MNTRLWWFGAMLLGIALTSGTALAQVAVPNTFSSNTPAYAAEVNENFTTLADAINNIGGGGVTQVSGYSTPYAGTDAIGSRNVIVLARGTVGSIVYFVLTYYTGSASSQIAVDGTTPTTFAYIEEFITVTMDVDDTTVLSVSGTRRGTADPRGSTRRIWYAENTTWNLSTGAIDTQTQASPSRIERVATATSYFNVLNPDVEIGFPTSAATWPWRIRDFARYFSAYPGSIEISGIPFSDVVVMNQPGASRKFILAKNIGIVWWDFGTSSTPNDINMVAYYYVNGSSSGSLVGTPFASAPFNVLF